MTTENSDIKLYRKLPEWLNPQEHSVIGGLALNATWEEGRQGTGYGKFNLVDEPGAQELVHRALDTIGNPSLFDAYLLRYPVGSEIPLHTDPALEGMCHVRLNAIVGTGEGGVLSLDGQELPLSEGDAYVFRPDKVWHKVSTIREGLRLIFSVGANMEPEQARAIGLA